MTDDGSKRADVNSKPDSDEKPGIEISAHPTSQDWAGHLIGFVIYTAVAAILPLLALHWYFNSVAGRPTPIWAPVAVVLLCAGGAFLYVRSLINRQTWRLTEADLVAGSSGGTRYPLDTIEKIILGLPRELSGTPVHKSAIQERKSIDAYLQSSALLVIFRDGSMLPLRIRFLENGTMLVNALTERYHHLVVQDYKYSESEIAVLKKAEPNRLIRSRHKVTPEPAVGIPTVTSSTPLPTPAALAEKNKNKDNKPPK